MTLEEEILLRGLKAVRAAMHAGFKSPGQFLSMSPEEKVSTLIEPPHKKLPRMLDAGDRAFWEHMSGRAP